MRFVKILVFLLYFLVCPNWVDGRGCPNNLGNSGDPADEEMKMYYVDKFKESFLQELNMRAPPRIRRTAKTAILNQLKSISGPGGPVIEECYEGIPSREKRSVSIPNDPQLVEQIITAGINTPDNRFAYDPTRSYFNLDVVQARAVAKATLNLFLASGNPSEYADLRVYKYVNANEIAAQPIISRRAKVGVDASGRVVAELTLIVRKWIKHPEINFGILIKTEIDGQSVMNHTLDELNRTQNILLHLEFSTNLSPAWSVVQHQSSHVCSNEQPDRNCCRYPLEVNLEEVGFTFVISPKRVNIFFCTGECPFGHLLTSRHAHMMQQASALYSTEDNPLNIGPCCVPTEFQNLTVLYMPDEGTVKETTMVNIIALRCGCS